MTSTPRVFLSIGVLFLVGVVAGVALDRTALAQAPGIKRTELARSEIPGCSTHEAVMGISEIPPGGSSGRHLHHGIELGYVLEGSLSVAHPDGSVVSLKAGQVARNGFEEIHNATNDGSAPVRILAVYIVEKGKPLAEPAR